MMRFAIAGLAVMVTAASAGGWKVVPDSTASGNRMQRRVVVVSSNVPDSARLNRAIKETVEDRRVPIRLLVVCSDAFISQRIAGKLAIYDASLGSMVKRWRESPKTGAFLLDVFCAGPNCVERRRDATGVLTRRVLSGRDPLQFVVDGVSIEVVYVDLAPKLNFVDVLARVQSSKHISAERITSTVVEMFPTQNVHVGIRRDNLFFACETLPEGYWLWEQILPDDLLQFADIPMELCSRWRSTGGVSCVLYSQWKEVARP